MKPHGKQCKRCRAYRPEQWFYKVKEEGGVEVVDNCLKCRDPKNPDLPTFLVM